MKKGSIIAIIPARGGSKRLPHKNKKELAGKPLIAWTIEEALKSEFISKVVVSTDDIEISEISKKYGAEVPFIRPDHLSSDEASSVDVVKHVIDYYKATSERFFDYILLLQPTSPCRDVADIDGAIEMMVEIEADCIISVCEAEHSPLWSNTLPEDLSLKDFEKEELKDLRSQDLPKFYRLNGAIYLVNTNRFLLEDSFSIQHNSFAYIMAQDKSIDIDTEIDFLIAELIKNKNKQNV
jgi:N-acylneuraminate cytidylyltransferase